MHDALEVVEHRSVPVERGARPGPEVIRRAATTERDAVVGRSLRVDDEMTAVADRLAIAPTDVVPERRRQRLGRDDERVDRDEASFRSGKLRRVALGRTHDDVGAHGAALGHDATGLDRADARRLVHASRHGAGRPRRARAPAGRVGSRRSAV